MTTNEEAAFDAVFTEQFSNLDWSDYKPAMREVWNAALAYAAEKNPCITCGDQVKNNNDKFCCYECGVKGGK